MYITDSSESDDEKINQKKVELNINESSESVTVTNQLKSPHTIFSFDKWTILSAECQIDERIEYYKRLLEETEQKIQTRDEMITTLQNQLRKIENMCQKGFDNTERYRFKYCLVSKELDNMRKICAQYKENVDNLIRINGELISKEDLVHAQEESKSWKKQFEELSKLNEQKQLSNVIESTQTNLDTFNIQEEFNSLKQQCSGIESILQTQNNMIDQFIARWIEEFDKINIQSADSTSITQEMLNNISGETANQNDSLQMILDENKSIKAEISSLKQQIIEIPVLDQIKSIIQPNYEFKCQCNEEIASRINTDVAVQTDFVKNNNESLLEQIEFLKNSSAQNNHFNEKTIQTLHQNIDDIENEKLKITVKYEEMCKKNSNANFELQNKNLQLSTATEEIEKLKNDISELQLLLETANNQNKNCCPWLKTNIKAEDVEEMQQLLQQYKEQAEFKKLENEKLIKREQELQLELQKREYSKEVAQREMDKKDAVILQLEKLLDDLRNECKEKEIQLTEEKEKVFNLESNLGLVQDEVKKFEHENNRSLTEISILFKHKETECFDMSYKLEKQRDYVIELEDENSQLKNQLKELREKLECCFDAQNSLCLSCHSNIKSSDDHKSQLIFLLHNVERTLMQILEENENVKLPPNLADEFLHQTRQLIAILEQRKKVDIKTNISYSESLLFHKNVTSKEYNKCSNCNSHIATETQSEEISEFEYTWPSIERSMKSTKIWQTMKQMLIGLEELKKELKDRSFVKYNESLEENSGVLKQEVETMVSTETIEKNLDTIEEELENQLHDDDELNEYEQNSFKGEDSLDNECDTNFGFSEVRDSLSLKRSKSYTLNQPCGSKRPCKWKLLDEEEQKIEKDNFVCQCAWCVQQKLHPCANKYRQPVVTKGCKQSTCPSYRKNT